MAFLPHGASNHWGWQHQNGDKYISGNPEVKVQNPLKWRHQGLWGCCCFLQLPQCPGLGGVLLLQPTGPT